MIRILVPLTASDALIDEGLAILAQAMDRACAAALKRTMAPASIVALDRAESGARHPNLTVLEAPLVRFTGVQKTYEGTALVVRDLDLDIRRGEFLTLLGPSGSGKTTTLMMLAGFETPTSGEISLAGTPITRTRPTSATSAWCSRTTRCSRT